MKDLPLRIGIKVYVRAGTYIPRLQDDGSVVLEWFPVTAKRIREAARRAKKAADTKRNGGK